jgi:hypothetical protein
MVIWRNPKVCFIQANNPTQTRSQPMRIVFLLLAFASFVLANIPTQTITNTPYAQVITKSKEDGFQRMLAKISCVWSG